MPDAAGELLIDGLPFPGIDSIRVASSFAARLTGWIACDIPRGTALCLKPCSRVHTFGVRQPIDVAHCDSTGLVLAVETITPNRVGPFVKGTDHVWEAPYPTFFGRLVAGQRLRLAGNGKSEV